VSSEVRDVSAKMLLRWSELMIICKEVRPNVVLLAHPDTGVVTQRAHVSQLKKCVLYYVYCFGSVVYLVCLLLIDSLSLSVRPLLPRVLGRGKAVCILTP
jgi:hypothetical protein